MKLKRLPLFYKIYFSALILFAIILIIFSVALSGFIKRYNEGLPETVSERFFTEVFENLDTEKIIRLSGAKHSEFETDEELKAFIEDKLSGKLTYTSISSVGSVDSDTKSYIVKSGDYKLASFTLDKDENGDYHQSELYLYLPKSVAKKYKILSSSKLTVNGKDVDESYVTETELMRNAEFLPEGVPCPQWVTYEITGLTKEPEVQIIDRNGASPSFTEKEGVLTENIIYDESEPEITERLLSAAKKYAACMQNDASKSSVLPYFEKGTEIYESIRTVENMFVWDHAGYSIENEKTDEFMRYDENTVSIRISFTHVLKMYGREDYRDFTDITFFARNVDGKYLIFAQCNNV